MEDIFEWDLVKVFFIVLVHLLKSVLTQIQIQRERMGDNSDCFFWFHLLIVFEQILQYLSGAFHSLNASETFDESEIEVYSGVEIEPRTMECIELFTQLFNERRCSLDLVN